MSPERTPAGGPPGTEPVRFERIFPVAAGDIDDRGHVNNVVYVRWVQDVAAAHWESATTLEERAAIAWVVLRHEIDYRAPAMPGDEILARTWVGAPTAATFERHTEMLRARDGQLLARARSLWCPLSAATGRPRRIDPALHDRFYR